MVKMPEHLVEPLARYVQGASMVRAAINGADAGTISRPGPEGWSIRDILVHLSDAEMVRATRIRMILTADEPVLFTFDEEMWKRRLHYLWRSPEAALALFDQLRFTTVEIFRQLDMKAWEKAGIHPEDGRLTVGELLIRGAAHAEDHSSQIRTIRGQ
ncbi:MAG: DinB family protein [bacterium]